MLTNEEISRHIHPASWWGEEIGDGKVSWDIRAALSHRMKGHWAIIAQARRRRENDMPSYQVALTTYRANKDNPEFYIDYSLARITKKSGAVIKTDTKSCALDEAWILREEIPIDEHWPATGQEWWPWETLDEETMKDVVKTAIMEYLEGDNE